MNFTSLLLSKIEEIPTLGLKAQLKMAPPQRFGTMKTLLAIPENVRYAAVMMLLYPIEGELHFCLIQRSNYAGKHSGQISFPGGKKEEEDVDYWATALRETQEEVGVDSSKVTLLKQLSSTYIPPSNFYVYPYMAYVESRPNFIPEKGEVAQVIEVPLNDLLKEASIQEGSITASYSDEVVVPMFVFDSCDVWGATAMILAEAREMILLVK
ncbi:CoA pyrophosphatase [Flavobacteriaceae bacterium]|nr:CoA pyrophosphatase [Flavobacteriaceae bacterium]